MATKLCLGTESGIVVLEKQKGKWKRAGAALEDKFLIKLEATPGGALVASARQEGVYKADGPLGPWKKTLEADVHGLAVSPHDPATIFAGTEPAGVFRSKDGGETWKEMPALKELPGAPKWWFPAPPHIAHVRTFGFVAGEPDTVFAGIEVGSLARSLDYGETWEELGDGIYEDVHFILSHPTDPQVMYSTTGKGFYRSLDGGRNWEFSNKGMSNSYTQPIALKPDEPEVLFVGSAAGPPPTFSRPQGAAARIYRSRDAGASWEKLTGGLPDRFHSMVRALVVDPADQDTVYAGTTDGEVYCSRDEGDNWGLLMKGLPPVWVVRVLPN